MRYTALCIVTDPTITDAILHELNQSGFTAQEISVVSAPAAPAPECVGSLSQRRRALPPQPIGARSLVGAAFGLLAGLSVVSVPGIGTAIGAGPLVAMLDGGGSSDIGGALGAIGLPQELAHQYTAHLRPGHALISVHTANSYEIDTLLQIFRDAGATLCDRVMDASTVTTVVADPAPQGAPEFTHPRQAVYVERTRETA
jgi:hypothetical protein